jgi:hypothetical protein
VLGLGLGLGLVYRSDGVSVRVKVTFRLGLV